jgi:hypothetical protein
MTGSLFDDLPEWLNAEAWEAFREMRKAKGKRAPFTPAAEKRILFELEKLNRQGQDVGECLWKSVKEGWSDVYPLKPAQGQRSEAPWIAEKRQQADTWMGQSAPKPRADIIDMEVARGARKLVG